MPMIIVPNHSLRLLWSLCTKSKEVWKIIKAISVIKVKQICCLCHLIYPTLRVCNSGMCVNVIIKSLSLRLRDTHSASPLPDTIPLHRERKTTLNYTARSHFLRLLITSVATGKNSRRGRASNFFGAG